ncbi:MAG: trypsin-like peptidase domain-containing protein, partial [Flavobacteriaceae bacterium]|nr:trypsin-like peptidase domain-containing protein [Flavobacteriaceae bacterium]
MKRFFAYLFSGIVGGLVVFAGISLLDKQEKNIQPVQKTASTQLQKVSNPFVVSDGTDILSTDFTLAAEKTVEAVVHVKNSVISRAPVTLEDIFFGRVREREMIGTGSGVIISPDGYIITNNHVINNANKLEVTLNDNSVYEAEIIGTDPEADIALIKINTEKDLAFAMFGDSDAVKLGEWVLAVGNPYNLNATVTAGIVSAKSREIERANMAVPYIQTDAAINSGNSGGALVNVKGELIGINTMIQSQNGSFIGYAFAVPSNNARKIVEDLMEYGNVQRGILGIRGSTLNSKIASELNLNLTEGVYVGGISTNTGADMSQLKAGDIIVGVDYVEVKKFSDLVGYVNTKRPGDEVVLK